ncbi:MULTISPECIES: hypothetical protein [Halomonas]|uniref:Uncharacterized protein n=1 Tax=Halomonas halophila TaxID=29573 RepID=A0ABQ0TZP5_9GAMM|nr:MULTISPECIES: hypothetical protein [Halomonas]MDR5889639.1 hypothetical protein [Halomonas salina]WJY06321.1 hypothetical protein QWG60_11445 [Halomonas halophila]GEK71592.1 hypothetical protein HHA04nite_01360 [Halomonas halophila]
MVAATKNRNTPTRAGTRRSHPVAAGSLCYAGAIAVMNAAGYAAPASTATGLTALGVFYEQVDNTSGADGDELAQIERGCFHFANDGGDPIDRTMIGTPCYLVDNQTVAATDGTGTRSAAGVIDDVDDNGVWVLIDPTA